VPKATQFKTNSVIYFQGDLGDKIFILKSGRVLLKSQDIETGEEIKELIATGEFFGVKSALGKYPRDETALVLADADVLLFSVPEFEQLVLSNTRIIMKMLKVFSNQLRHIHGKVQTLISKADQADPETGLYSIGEYYFNNRQYKQAIYAFSRYLTYYPSGRFSNNVASLLNQAEGGVAKTDSTALFAAAGASLENAAPSRPLPPSAAEEDLTARGFFEAVSLANQEKYPEAYKIFQKIVASNSDPEHAAKAEFEMGRCLVMTSRWDEAIRHLTGLIQKYPKHPDLKDALYLIGRSYQGKNDLTWARNFYQKILGLSSEDEPVAVKTRRALREIEGTAK
jgi:CRP-like cAMP-binding protein